ncbi:MAG: hypothetical protein V7K26_13480 [Nostoc sp.]
MNRPISVRIIHQLEEKLQARLIALLHENQPDLYLGRIWAEFGQILGKFATLLSIVFSYSQRKLCTK